MLRCYEEGRITDHARQRLVDEILRIRGECGMLTVYDWINIPLVYLQVSEFFVKS